VVPAVDQGLGVFVGRRLFGGLPVGGSDVGADKGDGGDKHGDVVGVANAGDKIGDAATRSSAKGM
jgi:hypothetical protein